MIFTGCESSSWGTRHSFLSLCQNSWGKIPASPGTEISEDKLSIPHRKERKQQKCIQIIFSSPLADWKLDSCLARMFLKRPLNIHSAFSASVCLLQRGSWNQPSPLVVYPQTVSEISVPLWIVGVQSFCSTQLGSNNDSMVGLWPFA